MGSICTNNFQKEEGTETVDNPKNSVILHVTLGTACQIDLVLGHYKQHRSDSLLVLAQQKNIQHCDQIREYTNDADKTIEIITNLRKTLLKPAVNKACPYKKLLLCVLPQYKSQESTEYQQQFRNLLKQIFQSSKDITVQFVNTIQGIHTLPNQLLLDVLLKELVGVSSQMKINLITTEKKMMNMYKYELIKTEACSIRYTSAE